MNQFWITCAARFTILLSSVVSHPLQNSIISDKDGSMYTVEKESPYCSKMEFYKWSSEFHECFMDKKYKDGGQNLNSIVDRILQHAETCTENSTRHCRLSYRMFTKMMDKIIEQIKDYSKMYLEAIFKGREDIKDLKCVETTLNVETYQKCFENVWKFANSSKEDFESSIKKSIACSSNENKDCSKEAKTSMNRIVRYLLGQSQPKMEDLMEEIQPTPAEPPKRWYDYIIQPFISAWRAIRNFFGF